MVANGEMQGYTRMFDPSFVMMTIRPGDDQRLWNKQKAYATVVLNKLLKTTQGLRFLSVHEGDPWQHLLSYQAHVLKSTNTGTIISQAHSAHYSNPISKHQGTQVSFLNTVSEHFKTIASFGHIIDDKTKIAEV